jgi:WXG100 protein secretion system (Wss), protein YukD
MQMLFVTVIGPQRTIDLELPGDVPIKELLPTLISLCGSPGSSPIRMDACTWGLGVADAPALLPVSNSLIAGKVVNGTILWLRKLSSSVSGFRQKEKFAPETIQPGTTGGIGIRWSKDGLLNG